MHQPRLSRRQLISLMGASAVSVVAAGCGTDTVGSSTDTPTPNTVTGDPAKRFRHGVASGEPLPDAVVIWTRVTPANDAMPGSGKGAATEVFWEVANGRRLQDAAAVGPAQFGSHTRSHHSCRCHRPAAEQQLLVPLSHRRWCVAGRTHAYRASAQCIAR